MWTLTLVVFGVVLVVVAVLLALILSAARRVLGRVSAIWTVGQQVANNTIHIALLDPTLHIAGSILACAKRVVAGTAALKTHAEGCAGCPSCAIDPGGSR